MAIMKSLTLNGKRYDIAAGGGSTTTVKAVTLSGSGWTSANDYQHYQKINIDGVTKNTRIEIQPTTPGLLELLYVASLGLYVENNEGEVMVYAVGTSPAGTDLSVQLSLTEVEVA